MTICASVKVRDGLVLATDSMTQIQGRSPTGVIGVIKTYSNARKLFQVTKSPMGVMSYGIGNISNRSIQGFMRDFSPNTRNVKSVADSLYAFIRAPYDSEFSSLAPNQKPVLGFYIAGYSGDKQFAEEWEFLLPRDNEPKVVRPETDFGASWRGVDLPFTRLHKGFDPRIRLKLVAAGLSENVIKGILDGLESPVIFDGMPVQDAVNFGAYIVRTTIGLSTFQAGPPVCGGPLQVATILPESGFEWVMNPTLAVHDLS